MQLPNLAIVIPAYKDLFLDKTLRSFANQSNKNFKVYVGDDASPNNLKSICDNYINELEIYFHRFDVNIGAKNLVNQWTRCIGLTQNEDWIWLFSDDDLVDANCVESFFNTLKFKNLPKTDIYRFNTVVIDQNDTIIQKHNTDPLYESSEAMAYNLLLSKRSNSLADHIFSRNIYIECGGLVYTEYAQGADWAMSILFSSRKGIRLISGGSFYWRYSGSNISSNVGNTKAIMLPGHLQFVRWIVDHFSYLKTTNGQISYEMMISALKENLINVLIFHFKGFTLRNTKILIDSMRKSLGMSYIEIFNTLFLIFKKTNVYVGKISNLKNKLL